MASTAQPGGSPIDLDYLPTIRDYVMTAVASASRSVIAIALGTYLVLIAIVPILGGDLASWMSMLVGLALLSGFYVAPFIWSAVRRRPDLMLGPHHVTVDAWGVRTETATARAELAWPTFRRVRETAGGFLLDYGTGANALIPKHAFDAATLVRFRELAAGAGKLDQSSRWRGTAIGIAIGGGAAIAFILIVSAPPPP
jgi:hypothetical protein